MWIIKFKFDKSSKLVLEQYVATRLQQLYQCLNNSSDNSNNNNTDKLHNCNCYGKSVRLTDNRKNAGDGPVSIESISGSQSYKIKVVLQR